ncbi:hypothetical protein CCACVL1_01505, partial [Corchorus capsularis]
MANNYLQRRIIKVIFRSLVDPFPFPSDLKLNVFSVSQ